jgi:hypothetical protein
VENRNRNIWIIVIVVLLALCCCVALVVAGAVAWFTPWSFDLERQVDLDIGGDTERIEKTFDAGPEPTLRVDSFAGNVTVRQGSGGTIRVVATKQAARRSDLDRIRIDWSEQEDGLWIETSHTRNRASNISVNFEITVPAGTRVDLDTGAGNIRVEGLSAEVVAHTGAGNVDVSDAAGRAILDTGAGNVTYEGIPEGDCRYETGAGNINLSLPAEVDVEVVLSTGIGSIDADEFEIDGEVSRRSIDGIIGTGARGRIEADTGAGNIDLVRR